MCGQPTLNNGMTEEQRLEKQRQRSRRKYFANKEHHLARCKAYDLADPERAKARRRSYYLKNREKILARTSQWAKTNKDSVRRAVLKYRLSHPEKIKEARIKRADYIKSYGAEWYLKNKAKKRAKDRSWRERNREKLNEKWRARHAENPAKNRIKGHNQAALRRGAGTLSKDIVSKLMRLQRSKCAICNTSLVKAKMEVDHIIPISRGGPNIDRNVQLLCQFCNRSKHAKDPIKFMQQKGFLL